MRKFEFEDISRILEIERRSFKDPYDISTFLLFWALDPDGFLVAEVNGSVVGYVIASHRDEEIVSIAVMPEFRRKGVGRRLMEEAMEYLKGKGARKAELMVRVGNVGAIKFYEGLGFEKVGVVPKYYGNEDGIKMVRMLDP